MGDIHANLAAFQAVLADIQRRGGVEKLWCLGDVVGYGPDPHECIELLSTTDHICIAGNHDWAAIGRIDTADFNPDAAAAADWTAHQLSPEDTEYLTTLPLTIREADFTLVHGSPREPIWEYLMSISLARENFTYFKSLFCLVGHSHVPAIFTLREDGTVKASQFQSRGRLLGKDRLIINPGSVGQPRDGDPRASYAWYDSEAGTIKLRRVPYNIRATQERMTARGLPVRLVSRLSYGV